MTLTQEGAPGPSHRPRLLVASVVMVAPGAAGWILHGFRGSVISQLPAIAMLAVNVWLTRAHPGLKRAGVGVLQHYLINPPVKALLSIGVLPLGYALLETTGRRTGRPRRTPIGNGLVGDTFWIVAEHGASADYVRNLIADPRVRVKVRTGLLPRWRDGIARVLPDDDPHARQRSVSRWHPLRALNVAVVRVMGTDLLSIRVDLTD